MTTIPMDEIGCLHDARVCELVLSTHESGDRSFRLRLRCDVDCGWEQWNGKTIQIVFLDPLIVNADLYGHMANIDEFDAWVPITSGPMKEQVARLVKIGFPVPRHIVELVFHSGSVFEIACEEISFEVIEQ